MDSVIKQAQKSCMSDLPSLPDMGPGDLISVHIKITEKGKERIQRFKGVILKLKGTFSQLKSLTVRKEKDGIGVERIFLLPSPNVPQIEVHRKAKVCRANLSFLRRSKKKIKYKI